MCGESGRRLERLPAKQNVLDVFYSHANPPDRKPSSQPGRQEGLAPPVHRNLLRVRDVRVLQQLSGLVRQPLHPRLRRRHGARVCHDMQQRSGALHSLAGALLHSHCGSNPTAIMCRLRPAAPVYGSTPCSVASVMITAVPALTGVTFTQPSGTAVACGESRGTIEPNTSCHPPYGPWASAARSKLLLWLPGLDAKMSGACYSNAAEAGSGSAPNQSPQRGMRGGF